MLHAVYASQFHPDYTLVCTVRCTITHGEDTFKNERGQFFYSALRQTSSGPTSWFSEAFSVLQEHRTRRCSRHKDRLRASFCIVFPHARNTSFKRQQLASGALEYLWTNEPHRAGFKQVRKKKYYQIFDIHVVCLQALPHPSSLSPSLFLPPPSLLSSLSPSLDFSFSLFYALLLRLNRDSKKRTNTTKIKVARQDIFIFLPSYPSFTIVFLVFYEGLELTQCNRNTMCST